MKLGQLLAIRTAHLHVDALKATIRGIVAEGFRAIDADFEARLRSARETGELNEDADPEALAVLASATMHTIALRARAGSSRENLRALALKAIRVIVSA